MTADGEEFEAGPATLGSSARTRRTCSRTSARDRVDAICIHASPRMIEEDLV
jgi:hypothetical protein